MTGNQHSASNRSEHCTNDNAPEHEAPEPKLIAEQHRRAPSGPKHLDADPLTGGPPPSSPEQPANPLPSQQPQYPADPMDPLDPNSPNPIEGGRERLFPTEVTRQKPPNE